ncbi:NAD(P)H-dependent oxidoreductase [Alkalihalobacillus oceani]|uniref:NAD(P)H-dependent oxidoreductase n=1 Tax=Halalkalibacter oceani TaxID=1653776 RepID=UPI0020426204|nr:NAD(P)H-dependent oxidoreductase [Halalkalibacter oceani]MCM3762117.1 NAD(P)H-dependent oxidoreductase [Halalkalibacter oceani]
MKHLLLISGHDRFARATGTLNRSLVTSIMEICQQQFEIKLTEVVDGYNQHEEVEKFKWADVVIIQAPIYWFSFPGILKKYIDDVFIPELFFGKAEQFGRGGKMTDKKYMLSLTWGAGRSAFQGKETDFLEGLTEDQVLFSVHKAFEYCGFTMLPTFSVHSAMQLQSLEQPIKRLHEHLLHYVVHSEIT